MSPAVNLVLFVDHGEQAVGAGYATLQRRVDVGNAPYGLQHPHHRRKERDELTCRQAALHGLARGHGDNEGDTEAENGLSHGGAQRTNSDQFHVLLEVAFVGVVKSLAFESIATERLDHGIATTSSVTCVTSPIESWIRLL